MKMKQRLLLILLILVLIFAFAGCWSSVVDENNPYPGHSYSPYGLELESFEELAQAKKNADQKYDPVDLKNLDYYYIPIYAEKNYEPAGSLVFPTWVAIGYGLPEEGAFVLTFDRDLNGDESLANEIDPKNYGNGIAPQLLESVKGVYWEDLSLFQAPPHDVTQFHWVHEGHYILLSVSKALMDFIYENDPGALEGPLFELRKVVLE